MFFTIVIFNQQPVSWNGYSMRSLLFFIPLFIISCTTAEINADKNAMKSIKTVAIIPFTSAINLKKEILTESEEKFRGVFSDLNYKIVETEKPELRKKDKEIVTAGITSENVKETGKLSGADAVLFGEITDCEQVQYNTVFYNAHRFGGLRHHHDEMKPLINYKFQIIVKLVNVSDGSVILSVKNRYKGGWYDEDQPGFNSLDSYRKMVLKKMVNELVAAMKEIR